MLTQEEAEALGARLESLSCNDPQVGDGLFLYVLKGEPPEQAARYQSHMRLCEHCRSAFELYRYKRDIAEALGKDSRK